MGGRWTILAALFVARLSMGFQFQVVAATGSLLQRDLGIDFGELGLLIGLHMLPGVLIAPPGGWIGARFGDKRMVLVGLAMMAIGGVAGAYAESFAGAVAARVLSGTGAILLNVLMAKMVTDWFTGRELVLAMAIFITSWPVGLSLGLLILGPLAAMLGWGSAFHATAVMALIGFASVATIYRPAADQVAAAVVPGLDRDEWRGVLLAGVIWAMFNVAFIVPLSFGPTLLVERGHDVATAASLTSILSWVSAAAVPLGGVIAHRGVSPTAIILLGVVGMAVPLALLPFAPVPILWLLIIGVVGVLPAGAIMALPAQCLRPQNRGFGMGIYFGVFYLGMALLPGLAGKLRDLSGAPWAPFAAGVGFALAAALALLAFRWTTRSRAAAVAAT